MGEVQTSAEALKEQLQRQTRHLATARRAAGYWEREAVLRVATITQALGMELQAGRALARALKAFLNSSSEPGALKAIEDALTTYYVSVVELRTSEGSNERA